jgi:hypothetical protein
MLKKFLGSLLLFIVPLALNLAQDKPFVFGGEAEVNVTDPEGLSVREGAGLDYAIIERLPDGSIVTIISGPVESDGFVWWHIQTPAYNQGWAVEAADGIQTLIPIPMSPETEFPEAILSNSNFNFTATYLSWSPDDKYLAIANEIDGETETGETFFSTNIMIFDTESGHVKQHISLDDSPFSVEYLQWSTDSQYLGVMGATFFAINLEDSTFTTDNESIEWASEPERRLRYCCDPNPLNNLTDMILERDDLIIQAGNPATLSSPDLNLELGNSTGGLSWWEDGETVLLWSNNTDGNCLAEVWSLQAELLLQVPHCSYFTYIGGMPFFAPALSHDEARLATWTMDVGGDGWVISTLSIYEVPLPSLASEQN